MVLPQCFTCVLHVERVTRTHILAFSDVDECSTDIAVCGTGAECINLNGSFSCQCLVGFQKTGNNCTGLINALTFMYFNSPFKPN